MITISDIASKSGVSRTTVSYVLNGRETSVRIGDETRRRVLEAASELGYRRNALAHAVTTGRNPVLGFLVCTPEAELTARLLSGALDEVQERGYFVKVLRLQANEVNSAVIERCAENRLAGVMVLYLAPEQLKYLQQEMARYAIPVAVLDDSFPQSSGIRVISDDINGCREAVEHLANLGHTRIAFLSGAANSGCAQEREFGFRRAMKACGLAVPDDYLVRGEWNEQHSEIATQQLLDSPHGRPTAILCAGDEMAMVAIRTAKRQGLKVPDELSIIGFGDITTAKLWEPPLTTVAQPFSEMGRTAVRRLLERIETPQNTTPIEDVLPTRLIVRGSTAPAA